jgi:L-seryl-tRNA(Ser) seleniumtransferase
MTYAALEATLALWAQAPLRSRIPAYRMLTMSIDEIDRRARRLQAQLAGLSGLTCELRDGVSTTGGGSAPESALPTRLVALTLQGVSAAALERRLRASDPAVIARIEDDRVVLDLRTVTEEEDELIVSAMRPRGSDPRSQPRA